ncbi:MAG TPA: hypothetical protein VG269_16965 [Tepidisphaeraceae bacterium]|jgi:hypothetical protein|nr:hypothetical protein [Tepidisphaeraceae bacterium]
MAVQLETNDLQTAAEKPRPDAAPSQRAQVKRFFAISAGFLVGFLAAALAFDRAMANHLRKTNQEGNLGSEVYTVVQQAAKRDARVRTIVLGDSVSRQLFTPGTEPGLRGGRVRFLSSNQAISAAGQYYLMEDALRHYPRLKDVYLFYLPGAWANDLPPALTHDYFCAYFHHADQVAEVFAVKRDFALTAAHAGRWLLPHVMEANSLSRPAFIFQATAPRPSQGAQAGTAPPPPDPEPLLTALSGLCAPQAPAIFPPRPGMSPIVMSPVSAHYLAKMHAECKAHGATLHVLPCPVSILTPFDDAERIYDAPIIYVDPAKLMDPVHFKLRYVPEAREMVVTTYGVNLSPHDPGK